MDAAKQRVLVHILAHTARAKVGLVTDSTFMRGDVDTDIADGDAFYPELPERFKVADESEQMHDEKSDLSFKFTTYTVETDKQ